MFILRAIHNFFFKQEDAKTTKKPKRVNKVKSAKPKELYFFGPERVNKVKSARPERVNTVKSARPEQVKVFKVETQLTREESLFLSSLHAVYTDKTISIPVQALQSKQCKPRAFNLNCTPLKQVNLSRGEQICLTTLEKHYKKSFYRVRPSFLRNPDTGKNLELDCFNPQLGIACEYNGKQHYHYPSFPNDTEKAFVKRIHRDLYKIETCRKLGICLIVVPYTIEEEDISAFILSKLP